MGQTKHEQHTTAIHLKKKVCVWGDLNCSISGAVNILLQSEAGILNLSYFES